SAYKSEVIYCKAPEVAMEIDAPLLRGTKRDIGFRKRARGLFLLKDLSPEYLLTFLELLCPQGE
ncbi:MAG: hypothetical protein IJX22_02470, partial [Opitutales bacterium]|nr:hypothetical protein [Opitutales bacterium]